jgi:hypothetical protein
VLGGEKKQQGALLSSYLVQILSVQVENDSIKFRTETYTTILNPTQPCPQIIVAVHVVAILACALRDLAPAVFFRLSICFTVVVACATDLLPDHAKRCRCRPYTCLLSALSAHVKQRRAGSSTVEQDRAQ